MPRKLAWLLARGEIRQVLKGAYVDARVPDSPQLRADGLRLVVPPDAVVCGRAAAWLHGIDTTALGPEDLMQALRSASTAYEGRPGYRQSQDILHYADRRAASPAESWLRLRLLDAGFGRPDLRIRVDGPSRTRRLDLGYPDRPIDGRRLGLEYDSDQWHSSMKQQQRDETRRTELDALGWHILPVRRTDLWGSYPALGTSGRRLPAATPPPPRRW